jgi:hypothetical protein
LRQQTALGFQICEQALHFRVAVEARQAVTGRRGRSGLVGGISRSG